MRAMLHATRAARMIMSSRRALRAAIRGPPPCAAPPHRPPAPSPRPFAAPPDA
ncbi:hypothetical protein BURPSPAST_Z0688 [Burkholderia pseudomallei Pasteur 52237]|uniref:Uncharacterized protein n=1 Tax=Burkholderia mallei (strain NCTC 10229) TaxID=412022 RepID=A2S821_BURM9|nr:hypothetical protein BMA10229_A2126 [Burkholderia mallei NCTC 10229]EDO91449.1 hypothetical protein BURPSPAST_Z0688 [Burkholderia pseudomallei Pasteur 52237]